MDFLGEEKRSKNPNYLWKGNDDGREA